MKLFRYDVWMSALASRRGISGVVPATDEASAEAVVVTFIQLVRSSTVVVPLLVALVSGG